MRLPVVESIEQHPRWKGGRSIQPTGYVRVAIGGGRWRYEHRVVAEATLGRPLTSRQQVHHLNGDKADNRPENLVVLGIREHALLHVEHHFAPIARWSRDHDACVNCGRTTFQHMSHGYCRSCHSTYRRRLARTG